MPKDRERYRYIDVGLERGSWTLAMFEEDARRHQMSDQPGKLMTLRLTEYYERRAQQDVLPSAPEHIAQEKSRASVLSSRHQDAQQKEPHQPDQEIVGVSEDATANADEAAAYWASV